MTTYREMLGQVQDSIKSDGMPSARTREAWISTIERAQHMAQSQIDQHCAQIERLQATVQKFQSRDEEMMRDERWPLRGQIGKLMARIKKAGPR